MSQKKIKKVWEKNMNIYMHIFACIYTCKKPANNVYDPYWPHHPHVPSTTSPCIVHHMFFRSPFPLFERKKIDISISSLKHSPYSFYSSKCSHFLYNATTIVWKAENILTYVFSVSIGGDLYDLVKSMIEWAF